MKIRMWEIKDGRLFGVIRAPKAGHNPWDCVPMIDKTIKTSPIVKTIVDREGNTVIRTKNGGLYELSGPSRADII